MFHEIVCMSHCLSLKKGFLNSTAVADRQQHRLVGKSRDEYIYLYRPLTIHISKQLYRKSHCSDINAAQRCHVHLHSNYYGRNVASLLKIEPKHNRK